MALVLLLNKSSIVTIPKDTERRHAWSTSSNVAASPLHDVDETCERNNHHPALMLVLMKS